MDFLQHGNWLLFLLFFVPGFTSLKIYDMIVPNERRDVTKFIFDIAAYSFFNYAFASPVILLIIRFNLYSTHFGWFMLLSFILIFVLPILWPFIFVKLPKWLTFLPLLHPVQKPWDYVFGLSESFWVIVHLKDGRKLGGLFGTKSFASSFPAKEQLYLEKAWKLDDSGNFLEELPRSRGIIILTDEIEVIELLGEGNNEPEGQVSET